MSGVSLHHVVVLLPNHVKGGSTGLLSVSSLHFHSYHSDPLSPLQASTPLHSSPGQRVPHPTMQRRGEENMVEPCDICGNVGFPEVIVTCSKCKVLREHVYCMRVYLTSIPEDWICESCQSKNGTTSPCKVNKDYGQQASKRQRAVTTGKVKFIPADEVIRLSSGNFPMKPSPTNSSLLTRKASVGCKDVISKIPSLTLKSNPSTSPTALGKLPRNVGVHKNPTTDQHVSHSLSKGPIKEHIWENQRLLGTLMPDKVQVQTLDLQIEKPRKGVPCEALPSRKSLPIVGSGDILSSSEKSNLQSIQENFNLYRKFLPSSIAAWRGQFQIQAAASDKLYDGFKAQPPCTVNSKAYRFSCRMPSVLQLESFPMLNVLTDVFQNDCPTLLDIALYFFPSDSTERSRKNLNTIFEFMNAEKLMLKSVIDGVELLVFTSNELNADSTGTIATANADARYFLWGVFNQNKIDGVVERLPDVESVEMDVDMIGGKDVVGRIDHVRKDKPRDLSEWSSLSRSTSIKVEEKKTLITSSHKSALSMELGKKLKSSDPSLCNSVKENSNPGDKLNVPPGFEAHANGGRSLSNRACLVGLSGRGRVHPLEMKGMT